MGLIRRSLYALLVLVCAIAEATARESFLSTWSSLYPQSLSDDRAQCQLCHARPEGGIGWNAYGWDVRTQLQDNGGVIAAAIAGSLSDPNVNGVENINSDQDNTGASNRTEIDASFQPGWVSGLQNTLYCTPDNTSACAGSLVHINQPAPNFTFDIDPPARALNPVLSEIKPGRTIKLSTVADGFVAPRQAVSAPNVAQRLFVVDQVGKVWSVNTVTGERRLFLDVSPSLVSLGAFGPGSDDERGLLSVAFHPDYQQNGLLYSYQSEPVSNGPVNASSLPSSDMADHQSLVIEWRVVNPNDATSVIDPNSRRVVLRIDQPQFNNNGGMLAFGPDKLLYLSVGDGGGIDDADGQRFLNGSPMVGHGATGNGQDTSNVYGSIIRLTPQTISSVTLGLNSEALLSHVFAYGFRSAMQFSFDSLNGELYAADSAQLDIGRFNVGEINRVQEGGNYGWNVKEGNLFFYPNGQDAGYVSKVRPSGLGSQNFVDPVLQYDSQTSGATIGGYVYRGQQSRDMQGAYIFGDRSDSLSEANGRLFYSTDYASINEFKLAGQDKLNLFLAGFGQDNQGEIYVLGNANGRLDGATGVLMKIEFVDDELCLVLQSKRGSSAVICL